MNTITTLIVILIVGALIYYVWQMYSKRKKTHESAPPAPADLHLENVGPGGMIRLMNVGQQMEEYDVRILSKSIYREGENAEWYELEGDNGDKKIWISLEHDDDLDVTIATRKLKLRDLPISRADLDNMDEQGAGEFVFEGKTYYYENSTEGSYFRNGDVSAENEDFFYYWEFETEGAGEFLTIEEWENGTIEATISYAIKESQVKVYSLGDNEAVG